MEKDKFAHEKRKDASLARRTLERVGLSSIVLYSDLIPHAEQINTWCATPHYQSWELVSLTESGKELKVRGPELKKMAVRKAEEQRIITTMKPDAWEYTITFNGKTTPPLPFNASNIVINDAFDILGFGDITVTGNLLSGIKLIFWGSFANKHQMEVTIDASKLEYKGKAPMAIPPKVERIIPTYDYAIVQQEWGKQLFALIKEYPTGSKNWIPMIDFFFKENFQIDKKKGAIIVEPADDNTRHEIVLRQEFGEIK